MGLIGLKSRAAFWRLFQEASHILQFVASSSVPPKAVAVMGLPLTDIPLVHISQTQLIRKVSLKASDSNWAHLNNQGDS